MKLIVAPTNFFTPGSHPRTFSVFFSSGPLARATLCLAALSFLMASSCRAFSRRALSRPDISACLALFRHQPRGRWPMQNQQTSEVKYKHDICLRACKPYHQQLQKPPQKIADFHSKHPGQERPSVIAKGSQTSWVHLAGHNNIHRRPQGR